MRESAQSSRIGAIICVTDGPDEEVAIEGLRNGHRCGRDALGRSMAALALRYGLGRRLVWRCRLHLCRLFDDKEYKQSIDISFHRLRIGSK